MRRGREFVSAAVALVVAAFMTGVPVVPEVDHDDDHAHIEHGHGGHEHVLMVEEGRVPVSGLDLDGHPTVTLWAVIDARPTLRAPVEHQDPSANRGRDPPASQFARPPPIPFT